MSRKKGKAQQRRVDWQQHFRSDEEDLSSRKQKFAPKAAKIPTWRLEAAEANLEQLPKQEGMVVGLFPGGAIIRAEGRQLLCSVAGTFRPPEGSSALAVGDVVTVAMYMTAMGDTATDDKLRSEGMIIARAMRKTLLARPQPRSGKHRDPYGDEAFLKVIAANMDQLLIVASMRQPRLRPALIERFLIIAERGDMRPLLAINKTDLASAEMLAEAREALSIVRVDPIFLSAATGAGLDELRGRLAAHRTVLAGASGVGKSTLVNALIPGATALTRPVRLRDERGRHTTAAAVVYDLADAGMLIDTPGVRELAVDMALTELSWYFPEFEAPARECHFKDCTHTHEPECAVIAAVEAEKIDPRRYESYLRLAETCEQE